MRKHFLIFAVAAIALFFAFAARIYFKPAATVASLGGVVSLLPSNTELLFALNVPNIKGVTSFCNYPPAAAKLSKVGDSFAPDMETILNLAPAKVIISAGQSQTLQERLSAQGFEVVVVPSAHTVGDILRAIDILAAATGTDGLPLKTKLETILNNCALRQNITVFVETDNNFWTIGKNSYINDILKCAGAKNIFDDVNADYFQAGWEAVVNKNPQVIIALSPNAQDYAKLPQAMSVSAVANNKIIKDIDGDILARPAVRVVEYIPHLGAKLHAPI